MNKQDFRILEGLRGLAAFVVVLNHARGGLFIGGQKYLAASDGTLWDKLLIALFQVTSLGGNAVIVFFVLSGFSIAHSVQAGGSTSRFYMRRVVRLVPPCVGGLLLAWLAYWATPFSHTFQSLIAQYWSLYQEAIFYVLAPLVAAAAWRFHFAAAALAGYLVGVAVGDGGIAHNFVFHYAFYFAVGVIAYHRRDLLEQLSISKLWLAAASVAAIGAMIATVHFWPKVSYLIAVAFSLVLIRNFLLHRLTSQWLEALGAMSYTLYITHIAAIALWALVLHEAGLLPQKTSASPWLWMTAVPVALLVSYGMYLVFEKPANDVLSKMRSRRSDPDPPSALTGLDR